MKLLVTVAAGDFNLASAISSITRSLEELDVEEVILLHTQTSEGNAKEVERRVLQKLQDIKYSTRVVPSDKNLIKERFDSLESLKDELGKGSALLVSPGGASLSAISSRVFSEAVLVHVSFPFSIWNGLTYPYVPREFQRVNVYPHIEGSLKKITNVEGLRNGGPLRRAVTDLVKKINEMSETRCLNHKCKGTKLKINLYVTCETKVKNIGVGTGSNIYYLKNFIVDPLGDVDQLVEELKLQYDNIKKFESVFWKTDTLAWTSGLYPYKVIDEESGQEVDLRGGVFIADTSSILLGILNDVYAGVNVRVPKCAIYELLHKYEESIKLKKKKVDMVGLISKLLSDEAKTIGIEFPCPPDFCDKALLQIDPWILEGKTVVTEDDGIILLWKNSVMKDIAKVAKLQRLKPDDDDFTSRISVPRVYYGAIQLYALFKVIAEELKLWTARKIKGDDMMPGEFLHPKDPKKCKVHGSLEIIEDEKVKLVDEISY